MFSTKALQSSIQSPAGSLLAIDVEKAEYDVLWKGCDHDGRGELLRVIDDRDRKGVDRKGDLVTARPSSRRGIILKIDDNEPRL